MKSLVAGGVLLTGAGAAAVWWSSRRRRGEGARLVVTVNRPVSDVRADGRLPDLLELGGYVPAMRAGYETGEIFGYPHAMGGYKGSHAEYVRVPFADYGAFPVPDEVDDRTALFASDAVPTGWMGADLGGVGPGDRVAIWGAGAVGQMAAHGQRYIPMLLDRMAKGELRTDHLITHPLEKAPHGYDLFKYEKDGCVRAVFQPGG